MKLIVMSSLDTFENEPQIVTQLFENGLKRFHLKKPKFRTKTLEEYISQIPEKYRKYIIIHSHYDLAIKYNLKGIHLNRKIRKSRLKGLRLFYYRMRKPDIQVTTSFHNLASIFDDKSDYAYAFLSPVFDSITKSGFQSAFSNNNLKFTMKKSKHKLCAFGGIDITKIEQVAEMNFSGLVLSGAIWQAEKKVEVFKEIKHKLLELDALD